MELQFNDLPKAIANLQEDVKNIERLLLKRSNESNPIDRWLDLNELLDYDPEKRTKATFYGYVRDEIIPFHKRGKKLIFLKSEIDAWLKLGRKKTHSEIEEEANTYVNIKTKK